MANSYVQTSLLIPLTAEQQEYAEMVYNKLFEEDETLNEFQEEILSDPDCRYAGFRFERESEGIWLYDDEFVDIDALGAFIFQLVRKFKLEPVGFTWSNTCSKPRLDEFGGGCCVVTQQIIKFWNAYSEKENMLADLKHGLEFDK
jgi:hypothetical protein